MCVETDDNSDELTVSNTSRLHRFRGFISDTIMPIMCELTVAASE